MRKIIVSLVALFSATTFICAQEMFLGPTEKWPYIFGQFQEGAVHFGPGYQDLNVKVNLCVADGHLHYIDENGIILESETKEVTGATINGVEYFNFAGILYKVIAKNENGSVVSVQLYDPTQMGKVDIGFGITSDNFAASTADVSAFASIGQGFLHAKIADIISTKDEGASLPLVETYHIIVGNKIISAEKKEFQDMVGKAAADEFLKANKIKWNKPETLLPVVDFIAAQ